MYIQAHTALFQKIYVKKFNWMYLSRSKVASNIIKVDRTVDRKMKTFNK